MKLSIVLDSPGRFSEVVRVLAERFGQLSAAEAARMCNLSPSQFREQFKRSTGSSFRTERRRIRMQIAAELIGMAGWSVADVAGRLGYSESRKVRQAFRAVFGMTPMEFRRKPAIGAQKPAIRGSRLIGRLM